jgi:hypothetical protein
LDEAKTLEARRAVALYALEMALAAITLLNYLNARLSGLNSAIDAFIAGHFELAADIARSAASNSVEFLAAPELRQANYTLADTAERLRLLTSTK